MHKKLQNLGRAALLAVSAMIGSIVPAQAAVPTGVESVFTGTATDFGTIVGYGWTLFLVIVGGLVLFKIVKKVIGKAT